MDSRDREAISDLFRKLRDVEGQAGPRDAEAERLIADETQRLPGASYYMAQTIVMQDMALNAKQREVDDLKRRVEEGAAGRERANEGGGFLSRVFGSGEQPADRGPAASGRGGPWGAQPSAPQGYGQQAPQYAQPPQYAAPPQQGGFGRGFGGGGGGFLAGAAQTAMGVAGGVVLGNAIGSMFGGHGGGLFGGGSEPTEVVNETTNIYEGDGGSDRQDVSNPGDDQGGYQDDNAGYQDASYDDAGATDDFGGDDMGGTDDV